MAVYNNQFAVMKPGGFSTIKERGPSAATVKFGCTLVKRRVASRASVDAFPVELVIFASPGRLSAFLTEDAEL